MNYATLVSTIKAYTENDFPDTAGSGGLTSDEQIDTFIQQAETRIYNNVQLLDLRKNVTGNCTQYNKYLACPDDYLASYSLAVVDADNNYEYLLNKDVNFIRQAYPKASDSGLPKYYAIFGSRLDNPDELSFILGPTPNANYVAELHYYYYPETIVTAGTTWLGDNFDSVLLYGTICEAFVYLRQENDMQKLAQDRYTQAIALYKNLADGKQRGDAYRDGQVRTQVA